MYGPETCKLTVQYLYVESVQNNTCSPKMAVLVSTALMLIAWQQ